MDGDDREREHSKSSVELYPHDSSSGTWSIGSDSVRTLLDEDDDVSSIGTLSDSDDDTASVRTLIDSENTLSF